MVVVRSARGGNNRVDGVPAATGAWTVGQWHERSRRKRQERQERQHLDQGEQSTVTRGLEHGTGIIANHGTFDQAPLRCAEKAGVLSVRERKTRVSSISPAFQSPLWRIPPLSRSEHLSDRETRENRRLLYLRFRARPLIRPLRSRTISIRKENHGITDTRRHLPDRPIRSSRRKRYRLLRVNRLILIQSLRESPSGCFLPRIPR